MQRQFLFCPTTKIFYFYICIYIQVISFKEIPDGKAYNAMSSISAAGYEIRIREDANINFDIYKAFEKLMHSNEIVVNKKTKKSETTIDIKPYIYEYEIHDDYIYLLLSCGSVTNIKPELVIKATFDLNNKTSNIVKHRRGLALSQKSKP